jgi:hypothetical protein
MSEVITYFGGEKSGKTTLGFSAIMAFPDGIEVHFDFDLGRDRAMWRFPKSLQDRIKSVRFPKVPTWTIGSGAITRQWAEFERIYEMALIDPQVRVLFIDTGTQMQRLNADEYLENYVKRNKPNRHQLQQIEYRIPNARARAKIMAARDAQKLLIISHQETDIRQEQFVTHPDGSLTKESVKTGQKEHSGLGDIPYLTDWHLQLFLKNINIDPTTGKEQSPPNLITIARILTPNPRTVFGMEVPEPDYQRLMSAVNGAKAAIIAQMGQQ